MADGFVISQGGRPVTFDEAFPELAEEIEAVQTHVEHDAPSGPFSSADEFAGAAEDTNVSERLKIITPYDGHFVNVRYFPDAEIAFDPGQTRTWSLETADGDVYAKLTLGEDASPVTAGQELVLGLSSQPNFFKEQALYFRSAISYADVVMSNSSLLAYLKLTDEIDSETLVDEGKWNNYGTPTGVTLESTGLVAGADTAAVFDATGDKIEVDIVGDLNFEDGTLAVEAWVKPTAAGGSGGNGIPLVFESSERAWYLYMTDVDGDSKYAFKFGLNDGTDSEISTANDYTLNATHHVVASLDSDGNMVISVDGAAAATGTATATDDVTEVPNPEAEGPIQIGGNDGVGTGYFRGTIAHVAIYDDPLTDVEVAARYGAGKGTPAGPADPGGRLILSFIDPVVDVSVKVLSYDISDLSDPDFLPRMRDFSDPGGGYAVGLEIYSWSPDHQQPGGRVVIKGKGFQTLKDGSSSTIVLVSFAAIRANSWSVDSDTQITAVVGSASYLPQTGAVEVQTRRGSDQQIYGVAVNSFTVDAPTGGPPPPPPPSTNGPPEIASVDDFSQGESFTVKGKHFTKSKLTQVNIKDSAGGNGRTLGSNQYQIVDDKTLIVGRSPNDTLSWTVSNDHYIRLQNDQGNSGWKRFTVREFSPWLGIKTGAIKVQTGTVIVPGPTMVMKPIGATLLRVGTAILAYSLFKPTVGGNHLMSMIFGNRDDGWTAPAPSVTQPDTTSTGKVGSVPNGYDAPYGFGASTVSVARWNVGDKVYEREVADVKAGTLERVGEEDGHDKFDCVQWWVTAPRYSAPGGLHLVTPSLVTTFDEIVASVRLICGGECRLIDGTLTLRIYRGGQSNSTIFDKFLYVIKPGEGFERGFKAAYRVSVEGPGAREPSPWFIWAMFNGQYSKSGLTNLPLKFATGWRPGERNTVTAKALSQGEAPLLRG